LPLGLISLVHCSLHFGQSFDLFHGGRIGFSKGAF
jgi:hypothetical protein